MKKKINKANKILKDSPIPPTIKGEDIKAKIWTHDGKMPGFDGKEHHVKVEYKIMEAIKEGIKVQSIMKDFFTLIPEEKEHFGGDITQMYNMMPNGEIHPVMSISVKFEGWCNYGTALSEITSKFKKMRKEGIIHYGLLCPPLLMELARLNREERWMIIVYPLFNGPVNKMEEYCNNQTNEGFKAVGYVSEEIVNRFTNKG